jgi:drug/metabolite transporter (DMT)-like permease
MVLQQLCKVKLAYIFYFWLIEHVGPTRTLIVTYLLPCFALVYGAVLLHESIGINAIAGLALVLAGICVTSRKTTESQITKKAHPDQ